MEKVVTEESIVNHYEKLIADGNYQTILNELTPIPENFYLKGIVIETNITLGKLAESNKILDDIIQVNPQNRVLQTNEEDIYLLYLQGILLFEKGEFLKAKSYLEESFKYLSQDPKHHFYYKVILALIRCYIQVKDFDNAKPLIDSVQNDNVPLSEHEIIRITFLMGTYYLGKGEWNTALEYLTKAKNLAEKFPDNVDTCLILTNMSNLYRRKGDLINSTQLLEKAYESYSRIGNGLRQGITLLNIGILYVERGDYQKSLMYENLALKRLEKFSNPLASATCLQVISNNYYCLGRLEESYTYQKQCLDIVRKLKDKKVLADTLENIGGLLLLQGKLYESKAVMEESLSIIESWGDKQEIAKRYTNFGEIYSELGEHKEALINFQKAYNLHKLTGTPEWILESAIEILRTYGELGDFSTFDSILSELPKPTNQPTYLPAYKLIIDGIIAFYTKKLDEAKNLLEQALLVEGIHFTWQITIYEYLINIELLELNTKILGGAKEITEKDLAKIPSLLASMELLCKNKNLTPFLCKNYILQSQFALLCSDYPKARKLLNQASEIASTYGLPLHLKLIKKQEEKINSINISLSNDLNENNINLKENFDTLISYIHSLGKILADLAEKQE